MFTRTTLRWIEAVLSVLLIACVFLRAVHLQLGIYISVCCVILLCILYNGFYARMFLDSGVKTWVSSGDHKPDRSRIYSRFTGFVCSFIALFSLRFFLSGVKYLFPFVVVLSILLAVFFLIGFLRKKNVVMLHILLDGMRSMIIMAIPYTFLVQPF